MGLINVSRRVITNCSTIKDRKILFFYLSFIFFIGTIPNSINAQEVVEIVQTDNYKKREKTAVLLFRDKKGPAIIGYLARHLSTLSFKELVILAEAYKWEENNLKRAQTLEQAMKLHPRKKSVKLELAKTYLNEALSYATTDNFKTARESYIDKSRELFNDLIKNHPSMITYKAYIDFLERTPNSPDEIIMTIKNGIASVGESPYFVSALCKWHTEAEYIDFGLKSCNNAIKMRPNDSESHLNLAKLLADSGQKEASKESLIKTANRFPASANAQLFAAEVLHSEGKILDAVKHLDQAAVQDDAPDEALVLRAQLLFDLNRVEDSLNAYIDACKKHKEPRKPLIKSLKKTFLSLDDEEPLKKKFESELYKCKYVNRPERKTPKGFLSSKK